MNLRYYYNDLTIDIMNHYLKYQATASGFSSVEGAEHYWFTIKPSSPSGSWEKFQSEYIKLVAGFHRSVCKRTIGTRFNREKNKHLKPFLYAAPDFENSNQSGPLFKNAFNHVHGVISLRGEQLKEFKEWLFKFETHYVYFDSIDDIRWITVDKIGSTEQDLYGYVNYMNKNSDRKSFNLNPNMMLPRDDAFMSYLSERIKPHQDGSRWIRGYSVSDCNE